MMEIDETPNNRNNNMSRYTESSEDYMSVGDYVQLQNEYDAETYRCLQNGGKLVKSPQGVTVKLFRGTPSSRNPYRTTTPLIFEYMRIREAGFPKFKELAPEIRNIIWKMSLPGRRVISVKFHSADKSGRARVSGAPDGGKQPVLLHVCSESRSAALQYYEAILTNILSNPVYFNFDLDILRFTSLDAVIHIPKLFNKKFPRRISAAVSFAGYSTAGAVLSEAWRAGSETLISEDALSKVKTIIFDIACFQAYNAAREMADFPAAEKVLLVGCECHQQNPGLRQEPEKSFWNIIKQFRYQDPSQISFWAKVQAGEELILNGLGDPNDGKVRYLSSKVYYRQGLSAWSNLDTE